MSFEPGTPGAHLSETPGVPAPGKVLRTVVVVLEVDEGPHDVDDTIAELGAALTHVIDDSWGHTDDSIHVNALRTVHVIDAQRGITL